jgi:hypothetical protein
MAVLFPITQFFDNTGAPLAGGKVYTYAAGGTTPKTAYTTQAASVALANPVVLDSAGRTSGIWLSGSYHIVVKSSDGATTYHDLDTVNGYNPVDWTGLTASIADLNGYASAAGTPGTVAASKTVVVDSNKDIATFRNLSASTLTASTSITTPLIKDANGVSAVTIATTASQVNGITLTPSATGNAVSLAATGSDTNINLQLSSKGSGKIKLNSFSFPTTDGTSGDVLKTDGAGVLSFGPAVGLKYLGQTSLTALTTITTVIPYDDTIPQNTEGDQILSLTVTPTSATSKLLIFVDVTAGSNSTSRNVNVALFQDSTADALAATSDGNSVHMLHTMTSGTTSATTFKVRCGPSAAGTVYVNGTIAGGALYNGKCSTTLTILEVAV